MQEMIRRGVLFQGLFLPCFAHTDEDVEITLDSYNKVSVTAEVAKLLVPTPPLLGTYTEFNDNNDNGIFDEGEFFSDRNRNGSRDSCYVNLIYSDEKGLFDNDSLDYNRVANIWKNPLKRGSADGTWRENSPYRNNPWLWNVDTAPSPIMWLYFDYYGYYMMTYKSTSDSYFNYFRGDPVGQNIQEGSSRVVGVNPHYLNVRKIQFFYDNKNSLCLITKE